MSGPSITIDLDKRLGTLQRAVLRADIFMGIGRNAADHSPPISHVLAPDQQGDIQFVKEELTGAEQSHVNDEFARWIVNNGFRDLVEAFSVFLLGVYYDLALVNRLKSAGLDLKPVAQYERDSAAKQLEYLGRFLKVPSYAQETIDSLNGARNCFAHRQGIVRSHDVTNQDYFEMIWYALALEIKTPNGLETPINYMTDRTLTDGGEVLLKWKRRPRLFPVNQPIVLEKRELKEICYCVYQIGQSIVADFARVAFEAGALRTGEVPAPALPSAAIGAAGEG